jgi:hypothetical protein
LCGYFPTKQAKGSREKPTITLENKKMNGLREKVVKELTKKKKMFSPPVQDQQIQYVNTYNNNFPKATLNAVGSGQRLRSVIRAQLPKPKPKNPLGHTFLARKRSDGDVLYHHYKKKAQKNVGWQFGLDWQNFDIDMVKPLSSLRKSKYKMSSCKNSGNNTVRDRAKSYDEDFKKIKTYTNQLKDTMQHMEGELETLLNNSRSHRAENRQQKLPKNCHSSAEKKNSSPAENPKSCIYQKNVKNNNNQINIEIYEDKQPTHGLAAEIYSKKVTKAFKKMDKQLIKKILKHAKPEHETYRPQPAQKKKLDFHKNSIEYNPTQNSWCNVNKFSIGPETNDDSNLNISVNFNFNIKNNTSHFFRANGKGLGYCNLEDGKDRQGKDFGFLLGNRENGANLYQNGNKYHISRAGKSSQKRRADGNDKKPGEKTISVANSKGVGGGRRGEDIDWTKYMGTSQPCGGVKYFFLPVKFVGRWI